MIDDAVKERLLSTLNETVGQDKVRTSVLVLGEGINIQAARMRGHEPKDSWNNILRSLWKNAGGDDDSFERLRSSALQWTCLVELYAQARNMNFNSAEKALQATVCKRLKQVESKRLESETLYAEILDANFANVVWFNMDRRIIRDVPRSRFANVPAKSSPLHRRVRLSHGRDSYATNIWFPYGDVSEPSSIQIGHSNFDQRLMQYEDYRDGMMRNWFDWDDNYSQYELRPPGEVYWRLWNQIESWYDLFFLAPLVFVGVSLSRDDWPLWWLLHQRARNFVPFRNDEIYECPNTFYLTCKGAETENLRGAPAGIELVEFDSYDAMWSFLRNALAKKPQ
jgi:hypothetical protein